MQEFRNNGRKWKKIAEQLGQFYTSVLVKYRILFLDFQLENLEFLGDDEANEPEQPNNIISQIIYAEIL